MGFFFLAAVESRFSQTIPTVSPEAVIENDDDLDNGLVGQKINTGAINHDIHDLSSKLTDEVHLALANPNRLILVMVLENVAQWNAE